MIQQPVQAPNLNAFAERWAQSVQVEALDPFIVVGEDQLNHIVREYVAHYTEEMPRQAKENLLLTGDWSAPPDEGAIQCRMRLGGLLKHYYRQAARGWRASGHHISLLSAARLVRANSEIGQILSVSTAIRPLNDRRFPLECRAPE